MATNNKYDRQLRLWGAQGQAALHETTVVLLRATAVGTETLKNLVLPGIGRIYIIDDVMTMEGQDYYSNFFVSVATSSSSTSKPRAQVALELLQELNPDVQGKYLHVDSLATHSYEELLSPSPTDGLGKNILLIAADLEPALLLQLADKFSALPFIAVQSYGLLGTVRLQTPTLPIFQPKPDNTAPDLRLVHPFPAFIEYCDSIHLDQLDDRDHAHVPYPILLYKFAQQWKSTHDDALPSSFAEKQEFAAFIQKSARNYDMELNFQEAYANAYLAYTQKTLERDHLQRLLQASTALQPQEQALLSSLYQFLTPSWNRNKDTTDQYHHPQPPLSGTLPDMTADTQSYVHLQKLYQQQALIDRKDIASRCNIPLDDQKLQTFCANVFDIHILTLRSIKEEYQDTAVPLPPHVLEGLESASWDPYEVPHHTPLVWYYGLKACHLFHMSEGRYPGTLEDWESDVPVLQAKLAQATAPVAHLELIQSTCLATSSSTSSMAHDICLELCRQANAELHTIASVIGGVASQEAVKIITGQYIPFNNTYIYNGMVSVGGVYEF